MNKELLDEFVIERYGSVSEPYFAVIPTNKAYDLMGIDSKIRFTSYNLPCDTILPKYYFAVLLHFLANNYHIDGLLRESAGNTHDANWETEVTIFDGGGVWREELDRYRNKKGEAFLDKPIIKDETTLSDKLIESWAEIYDLSCNGEEKRFALCSDKYGRKFCFDFVSSVVVGTAGSKECRYEKRPKDYRWAGTYLKINNERFTGDKWNIWT